MTSEIITIITRGDSAVWIRKIYEKYKGKPWSYHDLVKKIPQFKRERALITAMHNRKVIKLQDHIVMPDGSTVSKKRATGISKAHPSMWVFTQEALIVLQRYYRKE